MTLKPDTNLMKIVDEFADFDLLKPKDQQHSPHFKTQETNSMFILTTQLKGYRRTDIKVESNDDGSIITISGEKPVQDMLMVGGNVVKKVIKMRGFQNSFKVPQGVVLDKINARFNETNSELIIRMPKATKRLTGAKIEELKTEEVPAKSTRLLQVFTDEELSEQEVEETEDDNVKDDGVDEPKSHRRKFKICHPVVFGSAFFVSLIVLVFHLVQSEKSVKQQKKRDQD